MLMMVLKRMLIAVPSLIGVVIVTFLLTRALPGDPAAYFAGPAATNEAIEQIRVKLGLDKPLYIQFVRYIGDLARGDLGNSLTTGQPGANFGNHRLTRGERRAEVAAREVTHVAHELLGQRLVEAELHAHFLHRLFGGGGTGEIGGRIARQRAGEQEGDDHHADQARHRHQQPFEDEGEHARPPPHPFASER